ncbi:fimbrial family protein [Paraburkholderia xenovorans LB400]|uniref:Fimbrial protein n=1 Tax=Paraburkholderia xenovorans (strain LB400) TaxID=266265 RepID=Q13FX5_PARXL|nr:fimbrial protein [Paraburkholderia xenovorans]ABE37014.1 Putative fimbrial protein [Paraburkholderia xenovorans LB400]AIP34968.1 fimbrial family protein [Paraburkholderia xenovorans LB400]
MRKKLAWNGLYVLAAACVLAPPIVAQASDGTITIDGEIVDVTCTVSVNGGGSANIVTLPTVSKSQLPAAGATAGATDLTIGLSACPASYASARPFFEGGANVAPNFNLVNQASSPAANVQIQLTYEDGTQLQVGNAASQQAAAATPINGGTATLHYSTQYYAAGAAAGAGDVQGTVTFAMNYF